MSSEKPSNSRPLVSLIMLTGFLAIVVTGLLSYGLRYSSFLSAVHTLLGLAFVGAGIFHLKNNLRSLGIYLRGNKGKRYLALGLALIPLTLIGVAASLPPFQTIIDLGYALKELRPIDRQITASLSTRYDIQGRSLLIDVKTGATYTSPGPKVFGMQLTTVPQMAIWAEDIEGNYLETLYVTKKGATGSFIDEAFSGQEIRRPEALPHWSHKRGIEAEDGLMVPSQSQPLADAITGATPLNSYELDTRIGADLDQVVIKMEVNLSYDYNDTYSRDAFPDDPVYNGSGNSAQPSLIYGALVDFQDQQRFSILELLGRGHHSGQHGELIDDLSGITTARQLIHRVIVEKVSLQVAARQEETR